jgi:hypothetical protein
MLGFGITRLFGVTFWLCVGILSLSWPTTLLNGSGSGGPAIVLVSAMYAEDAGVLDFVVATTGHGPYTTAYPFLSSDGGEQSMVLTGGGNDDGTAVTSTSGSCFIATRKQSNGELKWRRNVCSTIPSEQNGDGGVGDGQYDLAVDGTINKFVFTVDRMGVVRAWTLNTGALVWDTIVAQGEDEKPLIWTIPAAKEDGSQIVAVTAGEDLVLLDAMTGNVYDTIHGLAAINGGSNLRNRLVALIHSMRWLLL